MSMPTYNGGITIKTFNNLQENYVSDFNTVLKDIADHTHEGSGAGLKIHGTNAIQAATITAASIQDGTITTAKLAAATSLSTLANDAYLKWRNNADSADLNVIKVNTSDNLELEQDLDKIKISNNVNLIAKTSGGSDHDLFKVTTSDIWEFQNTARTQNIEPKADSTYDNGSETFRWAAVRTDKVVIGGETALDKFLVTRDHDFTVSGSTASGAGTYSNQKGSYTQIGKLVFIEGRISWSAHTGTGNLLLDLPVTVNNDTGLARSGTLYTALDADTNTVGYFLRFDKNASTAQCIRMTTGENSISLPSSGAIMFSGFYLTTA